MRGACGCLRVLVVAIELLEERHNVGFIIVIRLAVKSVIGHNMVIVCVQLHQSTSHLNLIEHHCVVNEQQ